MLKIISSFLTFNLIERIFRIPYVSYVIEKGFELIGLGENITINGPENLSILYREMGNIKSELIDIKSELADIKEKIKNLPNFMVLYDAYINILAQYDLISKYTSPEDEQYLKDSSREINLQILIMYNSSRTVLDTINTIDFMHKYINMFFISSQIQLLALKICTPQFLEAGWKDRILFSQKLYEYAKNKFAASEIEIAITALLGHSKFENDTNIDPKYFFNQLKENIFDISRPSEFRNCIDYLLSNQVLIEFDPNFSEFDKFLHEYVKAVLPGLLSINSYEAIMNYNKIIHARNFIRNKTQNYDLHWKINYELLFIISEETEKLVDNKCYIVKILDFTHKLDIHLNSKFKLYENTLSYINVKGYHRPPNSEIFLFAACIKYEINKLMQEPDSDEKEKWLKNNQILIKNLPLLVKYLVLESNLFIYYNSQNYHFLLPITIKDALNWYKMYLSINSEHDPIEINKSMSGFNWEKPPILDNDNKKILINERYWNVVQYYYPKEWIIKRNNLSNCFFWTITNRAGMQIYSESAFMEEKMSRSPLTPKESSLCRDKISLSPLTPKKIYGLSS